MAIPKAMIRGAGYQLALEVDKPAPNSRIYYHLEIREQFDDLSDMPCIVISDIQQFAKDIQAIAVMAEHQTEKDDR